MEVSASVGAEGPQKTPLGRRLNLEAGSRLDLFIVEERASFEGFSGHRITTCLVLFQKQNSSQFQVLKPSNTHFTSLITSSGFTNCTLCVRATPSATTNRLLLERLKCAFCPFSSTSPYPPISLSTPLLPLHSHFHSSHPIPTLC